MKGMEIFKKAYLMYSGGFIREDDRSESKVYYLVEDPVSKKEHQVSIELDDNSKVIKMTCDCTISSMKSKDLPLCSHMMTAVMRSVNDNGRPKRRNR